MRAIIQHGRRWLLYDRPRRLLIARRPAEVRPLLAAAEAAVNEKGWHAAGFLTYEAGPALDPALASRPAGPLPLACFGLYDPPAGVEPPHGAGAYSLGEWRPSTSRPAYEAAVAAIKAHIAAGRSYQVNLTLRLDAPFSGSSWDWFADLVANQAPAYAAYLELDNWAICSASPELFFGLEGEALTARPMKGTAARGRTPDEDRRQAERLRNSEKEQAENTMIVDLLRNDLGRVCDFGSVAVPRLFELERYPTVWQLTSTVAGRSRAPLAEILAALFPCGSITGAPKASTTRIIAGLEHRPRGIYTGSIGFIAPGRQAQFNVAIRTGLVDRAAGAAEFGVGGGVVWDSTAGGEYDEWQTKARLLSRPRPGFRLLESLRWEPAAGFSLLEAHLARLAGSAEYFDFRHEPRAARAQLLAFAAGLAARPTKVRLLAGREGQVELEAEPLAPDPPLRLRLAARPVDSRDVFLYHKTTHRAVYDQAAGAPLPGDGSPANDVLLWNERGEVTETTSANAVVRLAGRLWTPPVACGLLAGTFRGRLLAEGRIAERVIRLAELAECEAIYAVNSVRGWREAVLKESAPAGLPVPG
ncbi:MAG: aminodeoxychorismate synthase component I [Candidatus Promineifilaceae bacterium]